MNKLPTLLLVDNHLYHLSQSHPPAYILHFKHTSLHVSWYAPSKMNFDLHLNQIFVHFIPFRADSKIQMRWHSYNWAIKASSCYNIPPSWFWLSVTSVWRLCQDSQRLWNINTCQHCDGGNPFCGNTFGALPYLILYCLQYFLFPAEAADEHSFFYSTCFNRKENKCWRTPWGEQTWKQLHFSFFTVLWQVYLLHVSA